MRCGKPPRRGRRAEDEQARRDAIVGLKRIFKEAGLDFKNMTVSTMTLTIELETRAPLIAPNIGSSSRHYPRGGSWF
jgi:hypothetical protein